MPTAVEKGNRGKARRDKPGEGDEIGRDADAKQAAGDGVSSRAKALADRFAEALTMALLPKAAEVLDRCQVCGFAHSEEQYNAALGSKRPACNTPLVARVRRATIARSGSAADLVRSRSEAIVAPGREIKLTSYASCAG